jgi:tight adherence protein C
MNFRFEDIGFHVGSVHLGPLASLLFVLAIVVIAWSAVRLWSIGRGEDRQARIDAVRRGLLRPATPEAPTKPKRPGLYDRLGALIAASAIVGASERSKMERKLSAAGFRAKTRVATFVAFKVSFGIVCLIFAYVIAQSKQFDTVTYSAVLLAGLVFGWRLPDLVLGRISAARRTKIEAGMPDALDLLVICAEAGLNLEQSIEEISRALAPVNKEVGEELSLTAAEMRVLPDRAEALQNLGHRTGIAALNALTATLNQSIKFGTPLADSLRVLAAEMRNTRLSRFEEQAARLPVLLTMPLMMFIMPSVFIVIMTPLGLRIYDSLGPLFSGGKL